MHLLLILAFFISLFFAFRKKKIFNNYVSNGKVFDIISFFEGTIKIEGFTENKKGIIVNYFSGTISGVKTALGVTIEDEIEYNSGYKIKKTWNIEQISHEDLIIYGSNINRIGNGKIFSNFAHFEYNFLYFNEGKNILVKSCNLIIMKNENLIFIKTKLTKFGFVIANITTILTKK